MLCLVLYLKNKPSTAQVQRRDWEKPRGEDIFDQNLKEKEEFV